MNHTPATATMQATPRRGILTRLSPWLVSSACLLFLPPAARGQSPVDYEREIKPILARHCWACHGATRQRSALRLDAASLIRQGGESGPAIVPGDSVASLLVHKVRAANEERMPPAGEGERLAAEEVDLLKAWIDQGANSPADEPIPKDPREHWSLLPIARPAIPTLSNPESARNPIDAFVGAEQERLDLTPVGEADRSTLLRRVYLDLIGLPPTREELQAFLLDESADAYERVVDRLLASPRHGERWGRHWMDVWRYSDWYGSRGINEIRYSQRHIWRWRDWIVASVNADKGYDRMIVEMLAGDEVAPGDPQALAATGFLGRNWYKFNRNVWLQETVEHTAMGFLAVTMKCCRCHDHKYDPLSQQEYYQFRAFFEPHEFRTDSVSGQPDVLLDGLSRVYDAQLQTPTYLFSRGDDRYPDKEHPLSPGVPAMLGQQDLAVQAVALPVEEFYPALRPAARAELVSQGQVAIANAEAAAKKADEEAIAAKAALDAFENTAQAGGTGDAPTPFLADDFSRPRPEVWTALRGQWDYQDGKLVESRVDTFASLITQADHPRDFRAKLRYKTLAAGTFRSVGVFFDMVEERDAQAVYTSANDTAPTVQAFHRQAGQESYPSAGIVPCDVKVDQEVLLEIEARGGQLQVAVNGAAKLDYTLPLARQPGKFAIWAHSATVEFLELTIEPILATREDLAASQRQAESLAALARWDVEIAKADLRAIEARIAAERAKYATPPSSEAQSLALAASKVSREVLVAKAERELLAAEQLLERTRANQAVSATTSSQALTETEQKASAARQALADARQAAQTADGTYAPLGPMFPSTSSGRRLALARWIASERNPRTARVAAHQMWLRHFNRPLVPTVQNFGLNGKPPTHPALLDWLASELIEHGWSMKHLHRLIVTSAAYRRSSSARGASEHDLAADRENQYLWRMNGRRMEAEEVRDSLLHLSNQLDPTMGGAELDEALGQTSRRRSIYFRVTPDNKMQFLELFDLANPGECYERRESVVPQQALALANSEVAQAQSRWLARRLWREVEEQQGGDAEFVRLAFEQVLCRAPSQAESARCLAFLQSDAELLMNTAGLATFAPAAASALPPAVVPLERAREDLVLVLFNHNDFVMVR